MALNRLLKRAIIFLVSLYCLVSFVFIVHNRNKPETVNQSVSKPIVSNSDIENEVLTKYMPDLTSRTFLVLKSGVETAESRIPNHLNTTFKWYPNHQAFSDFDTHIAGESVFDCLKYYPSFAYDSHDLQGYAIRKKSYDEQWGIYDAYISVDGKPSSAFSDKYKHIPALAQAWKTNSDMDWYLFIDDTTIFLPSTLASVVDGKNADDILYLGRRTFKDKHIYADERGGIVLSNGAMKLLFGSGKDLIPSAMSDAAKIASYCTTGSQVIVELLKRSLKSNSKSNSIPDITANLEKFDFGAFQGSHITNTKAHFNSWCRPLGSFHRAYFEEFRTIDRWYDNLVAKHDVNYKPTYYDFFVDFIMPHASQKVSDWQAFDRVVENESSSLRSSYRAGEIQAATPESCSATCASNEDCYQWSFSTTRGCNLVLNGVVPITANNKYKKFFYFEDTSAGFMMTKLGNRRADMKCDKIDSQGLTNNMKNGWLLPSNNISSTEVEVNRFVMNNESD